MGNNSSDILEDTLSNWGMWDKDDHCAATRQYDVRYVGTPLETVRATGSPVSPIAIT